MLDDSFIVSQSIGQLGGLDGIPANHLCELKSSHSLMLALSQPHLGAWSYHCQLQSKSQNGWWSWSISIVMGHSESSRRAVANSQFRDYANILQGNVYGDVHYHPSLHQPTGHLSAHSPTQPSTQTQAQAQATVRIIPYPRNEDIVHRQDLVDQLNKLLPQTERHCSAALWGLGGSGYTPISPPSLPCHGQHMGDC